MLQRIGLEGAIDLYFGMVQTWLHPFLDKMGISSEQFQSGLDDIRDGIEQIGIEARRAERKNLSFAEAIRADEGFTYLRRLHIGIRDLLQWQLPAELKILLVHIMNMPMPVQFQEIRASLFQEAYLGKDTSQGAFARFLLFQGIRLNLVVLTWRDAGKLRSLCVNEEEIEKIAEQSLRRMFEHPEDLKANINIEMITTAAAMHKLEHHKKEIFSALTWISEYFWTYLRVRGLLEEKLRDMCAEDAVLIRNYYAVTEGEHRLGVQRLKELHPLLFDGTKDNAIDQRVSRKIKQIEQECNWPVRAKPAFIDLVLDMVEKLGFEGKKGP